MTDPDLTFPSTLTDSLSRAAERFPGRGIAVFEGRGGTARRRTYPQVLDAARQKAARISGIGVGRGDRVLVCLPTSWELLDAWLGALLLGAWPVAVAPAPMGASEAHAERVASVLEQIGGRLLVAGAALRLQIAGGQGKAARLLTPRELDALDPDPRFAPARPDPGEIAFLQLTSGSTGRSRAVMITHRAAVHNNRASDEAIGAPFGRPAGAWAESMVSWLPLNHDMGLVGCLLLSINLGLDLWLLNPTTFLARPRLWLERLGRHGVTFAPAPNFGYQLCAERIRPEELDGLDLSSWRAAMTGAEMIRPETVAAFSELTARCGFRPEAFRPCYGLAEGTLAVTFDTRGRGLRTRPLPEGAATGLGISEVVNVGAPVADTEVRIVAPDGRAFAPGEIGEVRVRGPGVFSGYFNDPQATAENLQDGWLCTGDLGFVQDGELFLTGRVKDLLIIRGTNIMPHELEWLAESVSGGGGSNRCGAFSIARGAAGEEAVLVLETTERDGAVLAGMAREIRNRIGRTLALPLADLVFLRRGKIPKTTSGKVQRKELRRRYLAGELEPMAYEPRR